MEIYLDRFPNVVIEEAKVIGKCENCKEDIEEGYEAYQYDDDLFCSVKCFGDHLGLEEIEWK